MRKGRGLPGPSVGVGLTAIAMTRIFWISGLSLVLFVFGGLTIGIVYAGISHRHLNSTGIVMLVGNGYIVWLTFQYLRQKLGDGRRAPVPPVD